MATLFTKIINGEIPGRFVWSDETCVAFLTIEPVTHGHTMVVSREEIEQWTDADPKTWAHLQEVARIIGRAQQLIRVDFENLPDHEVLAGMLDEYARVLADHDAVLFSDYGKGGLTHISRMIELARAAGKPVLVDPKGGDYNRYAGADVVTPNRVELALAIGTWNNSEQLQQRVQRLRSEFNLGALVLTRSEDGMSLYDDAGEVAVAADAREVFDVTGAGDTVIATLAVLLACGVGLRDAMPVANRAGGIVVGKFGTAGVRYEELFG